MTATQLWKKSGSEKPFKQWIEDEKLQGHFIVDHNLNEKVWNAIGEDNRTKGLPKTFYGIDTRILMLSAGVIVAAVIIKMTVLK